MGVLPPAPARGLGWQVEDLLELGGLVYLGLNNEF